MPQLRTGDTLQPFIVLVAVLDIVLDIVLHMSA